MSYLNKYKRNLKDVSQLIFDNATLIVYTWDLKGNITGFNPYGEKVTGYKEDEVIGQSWIKLFLEKEEKDKVDGLIRYVKTGRSIKHVIGNLWRTKFDTSIELIWTSSPIFDKNGNVVEIISFGTDITQHKGLVRKLNRLAYYDDITGLPNCKLAEEEVNKLLKTSNKRNSKIALLSINIDNFKQLNDTMGHEVANEFLIYISEVLKKNQDVYYLAKLNESEFGVIFNDVQDEEDIIKKTKKLLESVKQPWLAEGYNIQVSGSVGISIYPDNGDNFSDLKGYSNMAMCKAKENSRNSYLFYNKKMKKEMEKNIFIINSIEKSMEFGHFSLYYQPIINLKDNTIYGLEALIRWFHPERGYISPMEFIPIIEDSGHIMEITSMVFEDGLRQKQLWNERGYKDIKLSVNISGKSFRSKDLYEEIGRLLVKYNISPKEIILEITETAFVNNIDIHNETLKKLIDLGLEIALDDFGTGYSSLSKLNALPLGHLKIDKSFIDSIEKDSRKEALVKYIIDLTRTLNLKTVAEGVETEEQVNILKEVGCDLIQGYYFAKPMPANEIEKEFLILEEMIK